jgi:hypothetical protein
MSAEHYTITQHPYVDPNTGEQKIEYIKVYFNDRGEPTGEEQAYYGMGAEEWLQFKGYTSLRLLTLLDLEGKLAAAGKSSPKVNSVRGWINGILAEFATNPADKLFWDEPPFTFEETVQEALAELSA